MEDIVDRTQWLLWPKVTNAVQFVVCLYYAQPDIQHEFDDYVLKGILEGMKTVYL